MKIVVTGANGFIGKNLTITLETLGYDIETFDRDNTLDELSLMLKNADCVVHLAGVNRPTQVEDFYTGNADLTHTICTILQEYENKAPIIVSSSIQAELENDYGKSKRLGEETLLSHHKINQSPVYLYRFSNVFGKWSQPNYNTVIATWCHNIAHDLPIRIDNPDASITLEYIDDVVHELIRAINGKPNFSSEPYCTVPVNHTKKLGEIAETLQRFKESRETLLLPHLDDAFENKLYSTYLSFLPSDAFAYSLLSHVDSRGSFTEFVKSQSSGQVSINVSKPGITKGQHWHHSKNEKFLVVKGSGRIQLRNVFSSEVIEYFVDDSKYQVVDIPTGYTHNIINTGNDDMITVMWVNEPFDPNNPDTYTLEV